MKRTQLLRIQSQRHQEDQQIKLSGSWFGFINYFAVYRYQHTGWYVFMGSIEKDHPTKPPLGKMAN